MDNTINLPAFDALIDRTRAKFRALVAADATLFGGANNPRRQITIGTDAPLGTIAVPDNVDTSSTQGLMAAVDLTLLDPTAPVAEVEKIARRAKDEHAATVCVYPVHVPVVQRVTGGNPPPIAVVGFPFVPDPSRAIRQTLEETRAAIRDGAREIDMVLALNFKDGNPDYAAHYDYIRHVVSEAGKSHVGVKVILETAYLTDAQKVEACLIAKMAGAGYVKTSTGFAEENRMRPEIPSTQKGATAYDVALMRRAVGDTTLSDDGAVVPMGVKASGGVRDRAQALAVYEAGASRIGASMGLDVRSVVEKQVTGRRGSGPGDDRTVY